MRLCVFWGECMASWVNEWRRKVDRTRCNTGPSSSFGWEAGGPVKTLPNKRTLVCHVPLCVARPYHAYALDFCTYTSVPHAFLLPLRAYTMLRMPHDCRKSWAKRTAWMTHTHPSGPARYVDGVVINSPMCVYCYGCGVLGAHTQHGGVLRCGATVADEVGSAWLLLPLHMQLYVLASTLLLVPNAFLSLLGTTVQQ